jgi:hypothetical protein
MSVLPQAIAPNPHQFAECIYTVGIASYVSLCVQHYCVVSLSLSLSVFCEACQCLKHFSVFSTLVTLKSLKPLHVSA